MNRPIKFRGKSIQMGLPNGEYLLGDFVFGNLLVHKNGTHRILVPIDGGFENFAIAPSANLSDYTTKMARKSTKVTSCKQADLMQVSVQYFGQPKEQLHQLRDFYRQGWTPDWSDEECKWDISICKNELTVQQIVNWAGFLSFQTEELATEFLDNFRYLIDHDLI